MRLNFDRDLVKQLTGQRTASKKTRHVDESTHEPTIYGHVILVSGYPILFWQLPIDHFVNAQIQDVDLPRHA